MMNHEQRTNDKFRQRLQQKWVEEARSSGGPIPVDADKLWQRIDQALTPDKLPISRDKPRGPHLSPRHWAMLGAAALAFLLVMNRSFFEVTPPRAMPIAVTPMTNDDAATLDDLLSTQHEPQQSQSRWEAPRCDQTRQSCLFMAFL